MGDQGFYSECSSEFQLMVWINRQDSKFLSPVMCTDTKQTSIDNVSI